MNEHIHLRNNIEFLRILGAFARFKNKIYLNLLDDVSIMAACELCKNISTYGN